jgi:N-acetylglutamate synthase-like GNAT family acetyltransferase
MGWTMTVVRTAGNEDAEAVRSFLEAHHSLRVARLGQLLHPMDHRVLIANEEGGALLGVLTLRLDEGVGEVLTLHVRDRWLGTGTLLLDEAARRGREHGVDRLFLITTNDNTDALRFYQRRGFRLTSLHPGAVDDSRRQLKPEIPEVGSHGIPIRDELVLERELGLLDR